MASTWTAVYSPQWAHYFSALSSIPSLTLIALAILLIVRRDWALFQTRVTFTEEATQGHSFWGWQLRWWGGLLGLWFLWLIHCLAWAANGPHWLSTKIPPIEYLLVHYGQAASPLEFSYPWSLYMLAAFSYVWFAGILKKPVPESLSEPLFTGKMDPVVKSMIGWIIANVTQYCIVLTIVAFILLCLKIVESFFAWPSHLEMGLWGFLFISFALTGLRRIPWKLWGRRVSRQEQGLLFWSLLSMLALILLLPLMALICARWMPEVTPGISVELVFRLKLDRWVEPAVRFETVVWGWWILWTPLMASYLAFISRGQRFGAIFLTALMTPVVLSWPPFHFLFIGLLKRWQTLSNVGLFILASMLGVLLCWMLGKQLTTQRLIQGWMVYPKAKVLKIKGLAHVLSGWVLLIWSIIFLQAIGGWYILEIQVLAPALILSACIVLLNLTILMSVYQFLKKRA